MRIFYRLSISASIAVFYVIAGKAGLALASVNPSVSAVWAPTGVAIAAFLVFGYRQWPAILAGAFLVNITTSGSALASFAIAMGNVLEGLLAAYCVNRFAAGRRAFDRAPDIFKFTALAAVLAPALSATVGVASLVWFGLATAERFGEIWLTWWLGDATGALIVTPVLVLWANTNFRQDRRRIAEGVVMLAALVAMFLLLTELPDSVENYPLGFIALPILLWSAFRFSQRDVIAGVAILCGFSIARTTHGYGLFASYAPNESLLLLQILMAIVSVNALVLAAVIAERRRAEDSRRWLATIVECSNDAIIGKNMDGVILSWNEAAQRIYGYSAQEAIGQPMSFLIPAERFDEVPQILRRIRKGERVSRYDTKHARKDRSRVDVSLTVSPIKDEDGNIIGASTIARDLSDRVPADEFSRVVSDAAVTD